MRIDPLVAVVRVLAWMVGFGVLTLLLASGRTTVVDQALYDFHMRHWAYRTSDDIVVLAIDPKSLARIGSWPWPRAVHARLVDRLAAAGVRGIAMDVIMAEADATHPENDRAFAEAIRRAGNVVMPVFPEAVELDGTLEEMLPIAEIAQQAASLGHVEIAKDEDGVVRGAYLKAGLGQPYWPALALALYQLGRKTPESLPGLRDPLRHADAPYEWMRDNYVLLRYAGGAGSFGELSYVDVLDGDVPASLLKGKWVLVGATAKGLGDMLETPTAGDGELPGVEFQANLLAALRDRTTVLPTSFGVRLALGGGVLALPLLLWGMRGFRSLGRVAVVTLLLALLLSLALLRLANCWWPPTAVSIVVAASAAILIAIQGRTRTGK
jgi:CHASE2 domain-containing sensor protein